MFGLGKHGPDGRYGVIVDVGSGSVGIGLIASDPLQAVPEVIWTHRERTAIRDIEQLDDSAKDISTALVNAFLILGSQGFTALRAHDAKAQIDEVQVLISAPWSYTIAKSISSTDEHPFEVTKSLVEELIRRAEKEALALIDTNHIMDTLGLEVVSSATINITANDYTVHEPFGQEVRKITITHLNGVAQKKLLSALTEAVDKVIPDSTVKTSTFMFAYYQTLASLYPDTSEICLIDITAEATELGIVRDGALRYVTHMPYGTYTLAREIAGLCAIPKEEALGYIRSDTVDVTTALSEAKLTELEAIVGAYEEKLSDLFSRTGDTLAIPKTLFVHTDSATESFFKQRIAAATSKPHKSDHAIHFITSKLFENPGNFDSALLLSAYVFHKKLTDHTFD